MNVYGNVYTYYVEFTANDPDFLPIDQIVYGGYAQMIFTLSKEYKAEVSGWFQSPSIGLLTPFLPKELLAPGPT